MDITFVRSNTEVVKQNQTKRFCDPNIVDQILTVDETCKQTAYQINVISALRNKLSKQIRNASNDELSEIPNEKNPTQVMGWLSEENLIGTLTKNQIKKASIILATLLDTVKLENKNSIDTRTNMLSTLGNMLHENTPINNNEDFNTIVCEKKYDTTTLPTTLLNHVELCYKLDIIDTQKGSNISGNRGYFLKGVGVRLNLALLTYAIDFLSTRGYTAMQTPHFMNGDVMAKLCQLSDFNETLYKLEGEDKYMIATSEQPLTGYNMNSQFARKQLPIKYAGLSSCYRKETGSHGKDTLGIFRVHQFEKIEQLCITEPEKSWDMMESMITACKEFYDSLGLSYRVINIVSGALNNAASMKYDLEGFFAGSNTYRELVSCSNCTDYFSKKLNIKIGDSIPVHILNSTLCANTRTLCCILENYQRDGYVEVPQVLVPYMGGVTKLQFAN
jgi:seryl-tRNA synthetase